MSGRRCSDDEDVFCINVLHSSLGLNLMSCTGYNDNVAIYILIYKCNV